MGTGARTRPNQQQVHVPVKCITAGAKHLLWTSLMGILLFGIFLSHTILYSHKRSPQISTSGFKFSVHDQHSNESIWTYSKHNPAVLTERDRIKFVLKATDFGRISLKDALYNRRTRERAGRQGRAWMLPFAHRVFEKHVPRFVELSKTWLGEDRDFNPLIMQDLVKTVKRPLDLNTAYWSRETGNDSAIISWGNRYQSCAVVGNSGILLKSNNGEQIDSHEMVIRLNNAEIYPYTEHVGSKTTLSFMNSNVLVPCSTRPDCWCNPYGEDVPIILYICQAKHLLHVARCHSNSKSAILITHSLLDALSAAIVKWYSVTNFIQTTGRRIAEWDSVHHDEYFHYSSGMEATLVALGICDSVDLFGFGKSPDAKHHYHTEQKVEQALHDYDAEYLFYDDLSHNRTIPFLSDAGIFIPPVRLFF